MMISRKIPVGALPGNLKDGVIISENNGVVEIEAPYYSSKTDAAEAKWTEIPFMGKAYRQ